jgi:GntR family transcriptional regulator, transcriptional repressor for pyruvate dehydrogenase complex
MRIGGGFQTVEGDMDMLKEAAETGRRASRPNLVKRLSDELRRAIVAGDIKVGDKLPSEARLTELHAVSRTVVREAIAALRSDGLVEAHQGAGVFVISSQEAQQAPFLEFDAARISSIIEVLELRAAVEMESAALAAVRRSPAQEEAILEACDDIDKLIANGKPTTTADFALHLAIADATNNPRFREFLEMMGRKVIPRSSLRDGDAERASALYLEQIQAEHRRIADAISLRDSDAARDAMRTHLIGSQQRYRALLRGNSS